jgi:hypothetical protein
LDADETVLNTYEFVITESPSYSTDEGTLSVTLRLGGNIELAASQNQILRYCGRPPESAKDLAETVAITIGSVGKGLPEGHSILERLEDQSFRGMEAISNVYAVTDYDVHEAWDGSVQAIKRRRERPEILTLRPDDYITNAWQPPSQSVPDQITVTNQYNHFQGNRVRQPYTETYTENYDPDNNLPWFAGGWTLTKTTQTFEGATLVQAVSETFGYIPNSFPINAEVLPQDACTIASPVPVYFGLIATETLANSFTEIDQFNKILWRTERTITGLNAYTRKEAVAVDEFVEVWRFTNGLIARELTLYDNTIDPDPLADLCFHQKTWFQTGIRSWEFGLLSSGNYGLLAVNSINYQINDRSIDKDKGVRGVSRWTRQSSRREFRAQFGKFVTVPTVPAIDEDPPTSTFLVPYQEPVEVRGTYRAEPLPAFVVTRVSEQGCKPYSDADFATHNYVETWERDPLFVSHFSDIELIGGTTGATWTTSTVGGTTARLNVTVDTTAETDTVYLHFRDAEDVEVNALRPVVFLTQSTLSQTVFIGRTLSQGDSITSPDLGYDMEPDPVDPLLLSGTPAFPRSIGRLKSSLSEEVLNSFQPVKSGQVVMLPPGVTGSFTLEAVKSSTDAVPGTLPNVIRYTDN